MKYEVIYIEDGFLDFLRYAKSGEPFLILISLEIGEVYIPVHLFSEIHNLIRNIEIALFGS